LKELNIKRNRSVQAARQINKGGAQVEEEEEEAEVLSSTAGDCESDQDKIAFFFANLRVDAWVSYRKFDRASGSSPSKSYRVNRKVSSHMLDPTRLLMTEVDVTPHLVEDQQFFEITNIQ